MNITFISSFVAFFSCVGLTVLILARDWHSFVHRVFAIGMLIFAVESVFIGLNFMAFSVNEMIRWQHLKLLATSLLPGIWFVFSLSFARINFKEAISKWKWVIIGSFLLPLFMVTIFNKSFFKDEILLIEPSVFSIRLGWAGHLFYIFFLIGSILILMNLEKTLRGSAGAIKWQIKFMVLGLGGIFAVRIYTNSQTLLFSSSNPGLNLLNVSSLIVGNILITISILRSRLLNMNIYLSQTFLYNSIIVLMVGIYLLLVWVLTKLIQQFEKIQNIPFVALFVFLSLTGLTIFLLSDQVRLNTRKFISRHFKRPKYDYREIWREFTERTTYLMDVKGYCSAVTKMVSETLHNSSVTIWLLDEQKEHLIFGGSTSLPEGEIKNLRLLNIEMKDFISVIKNEEVPFDLKHTESKWVRIFLQNHQDDFREARVRYCIPLIAGVEVHGLITLNNWINDEPFLIEDYELLKAISDQTTVNLLNLKLTENIKQLKETEAYQTMAAFMMHDLKNLASSLSLTIENLPIHFENPEFRSDSLHIIQQNVLKINNIYSHLSILSKKIELKPTEVDLNVLVTSILSNLNGETHVSLLQDLKSLPKLMIDPDQIQTVLTNLVLNAKEAIGSSGEILIATDQKNGWVMISIKDNGCGMSKEFIERSLFRPFKTTKKYGMGIGLYHSKLIVEAHQGRIEVESEEGKGSTFRVFLPMNRE
jgi:putative PEP-CTERM system histidine kinase